jgi:hypothetical protein
MSDNRGKQPDMAKKKSGFISTASESRSGDIGYITRPYKSIFSFK